MTSKCALHLIQRYKGVLDKLSHEFNISEARNVGLSVWILKNMKIVGILSYKRTGIKEQGIWIKNYEPKVLNTIET